MKVMHTVHTQHCLKHWVWQFVILLSQTNTSFTVASCDNISISDCYMWPIRIWFETLEAFMGVEVLVWIYHWLLSKRLSRYFKRLITIFSLGLLCYLSHQFVSLLSSKRSVTSFRVFISISTIQKLCAQCWWTQWMCWFLHGSSHRISNPCFGWLSFTIF